MKSDRAATVLPADAILVGGLAALLIGLPWHEYIVMVWHPLGVWKELVLAAVLAAAASTRGDRMLACPWLYCILAFFGVCMVSALGQDQSLLVVRPLIVPMLAGLAAFTLRSDERDRILRGFLTAAMVVVVYALVAHMAFRLSGGAFNRRPGISNPLLRALVFPYYTPNYPRGDRLVGPFLNDDYFGIWCAAVLCLLLAERRLRYVPIVAVLTATVWTYSRSALCGLVAALAMLAWRRERRVLWLLPIGLALACIFLNAAQVQRIEHPIDQGGDWRIHDVQQAVDTLAAGSIVGSGPQANRVYDMQYARLIYQLGWAGTAVLAWGALVLGQQMGRARSAWGVGLAAACLALLVSGCGAEVLEVPQTSWTLWILFGLLASGQESPA